MLPHDQINETQKIAHPALCQKIDSIVRKSEQLERIDIKDTDYSNERSIESTNKSVEHHHRCYDAASHVKLFVADSTPSTSQPRNTQVLVHAY